MPMLVVCWVCLDGRDHEGFESPFKALEVSFQSNNGRLPFSLRGPFKPLDLSISAHNSSQFISGFLVAYAYAGAQNVRIQVTNPKSTPYIDLTLGVLAQMGKDIAVNKDYTSFYFGKASSFKAQRMVVENDWSSASVLLVASALSGGNLTLKGLKQGSLQADKRILSVLEQIGVGYAFTPDLVLSSPRTLRAFDIDLSHSPDLFPVLSALASFCKGISLLRGLHRLANKESNRVQSICTTLRACGIQVRTDNDTLVITGQEHIQGGIDLPSFNDHRIIMMNALLALRAQAGMLLTSTNAVNKSFPEFFDYWQQGFKRLELQT